MRKILVALDGSAVSLSVLPYLETLLRNEDADVTLARVARRDESEVDLLEGYLRDVAAPLEAKGASVDTAVLRGDPAREIVRRAVAGGYHLIALCSRGKTGLKRLLLGSVAEAVLRRSPVPVMIVHPGGKDAGRPEVRKIVVPLDGTHRASVILPPVAELAAATGAKIGFVSVVSPTKREELPVEVVAENIFREQKKLQTRGLEVELAILYGDPALETVAFAERNQADLVAIATHGRSGIDRMLHGSVAEKILRTTRIPILVVRPRAEKRKPLVRWRAKAGRGRSPEPAGRAR